MTPSSKRKNLARGETDSALSNHSDFNAQEWCIDSLTHFDVRRLYRLKNRHSDILPGIF